MVIMRLFISTATATIFVHTAGCGGALRFEDVDGSKKLVDLSTEDVQAACSWIDGLARDRLPPSGSNVVCDGSDLAFNYATSCSLGMQRPNGACQATVDDMRKCMPALLDRIAQDPCSFLQISSVAEADQFVQQIPACQGVDDCAYTL